MKDVKMLTGEKIVWENEADQWFVSPNLMVKLIMNIKKILSFLIGFRDKGSIAITNKRVIYRSEKYFLWAFQNGLSVDSIFLNQISSLKYEYKASFLVFLKSKILTVYSTGAFGSSFVLKKVDEKEFEKKVAQLSAKVAIGTKA
jgi:hypothetical protein